MLDDILYRQHAGVDWSIQYIYIDSLLGCSQWCDLIRLHGLSLEVTEFHHTHSHTHTFSPFLSLLLCVTEVSDQIHDGHGTTIHDSRLPAEGPLPERDLVIHSPFASLTTAPME